MKKITSTILLLFVTFSFSQTLLEKYLTKEDVLNEESKVDRYLTQLNLSNIIDGCKWVFDDSGFFIEFYVEKLDRNNLKYESKDFSNEEAVVYYSGRLVIGNNNKGQVVMNFISDDERFNMFKDAQIKVPDDLWRTKPKQLEVQFKNPSGGVFSLFFNRYNYRI